MKIVNIFEKFSQKVNIPQKTELLQHFLGCQTASCEGKAEGMTG
jgi:hypothetical protein